MTINSIEIVLKGIIVLHNKTELMKIIPQNYPLVFIKKNCYSLFIMENMQKPIIHPLENTYLKQKNNNKDNISYLYLFSYLGLAIFLGTFFGFLLTKISFNNESKKSLEVVSNKKTVGVVDKKTFKDQAEGTLKEGGIDGEGNFHLERPGGKSQNVYLTSSTVDLYPFVGKKVRVYGQTFAGQKAGWLMDVGYVEVLK